MQPIPPKPVLDSRRFGRTPPAFLTGLAACCLTAIVALAIVVAQHGPAPTLVGLLLAMLPIPLLVALILLIDRLEPEPRALLFAIFGAGAGVAVVIALLGHVTGSAAIAVPGLGAHAGRRSSRSRSRAWSSWRCSGPGAPRSTGPPMAWCTRA
jgi:protease PrsW